MAVKAGGNDLVCTLHAYHQMRTLLLCFSFFAGNFVVYKSPSELTSGQGRGDARPPEAIVQRIRKRQFLRVSSLSATRQFSRRFVDCVGSRSGHLFVYGNADRLATWSCSLFVTYRRTATEPYSATADCDLHFL